MAKASTSKGGGSARASTSLSPAQHLELYRWMILTRGLEERLVNLYRQNRVVGGLYRSLGQEAETVGAAAALEKQRQMTAAAPGLIAGLQSEDPEVQRQAQAGILQIRPDLLPQMLMAEAKQKPDQTLTKVYDPKSPTLGTYQLRSESVGQPVPPAADASQRTALQKNAKFVAQELEIPMAEAINMLSAGSQERFYQRALLQFGQWMPPDRADEKARALVERVKQRTQPSPATTPETTQATTPTEAPGSYNPAWWNPMGWIGQ